MPTITYNSVNVPLPQFPEERISRWLCDVAEKYGKQVDCVNYVFVDDEEILRLNRQFVHHDYYTDHIGFDTSQGNILSGDTYISLDTVRTNAELFHTPYTKELLRVVVHSILHLCGIEDKTPEERAVMEQAEDAALTLLPNTMWER